MEVKKIIIKDFQFDRFKLSEISTQRVSLAIWRRICEMPYEFSWIMGSTARANREQLAKLKNIHLGERCFIMGNGPSLTIMDLTPLKNESSFGTNRVYLLFDKLPFLPTYYVCLNKLVLCQFFKDIQQLSMPKFLNWNKNYLFNQQDESIYYLKDSLSPQVTFRDSLLYNLSSGGTVTYVALQIAFFMGFKEVILIGLDHKFSFYGTPNTVQTCDTDVDINHFSPDYFPKGVKWQIPDLLHSEYAYRMARENYEKHGRMILDATIGGKCPVFEKVNYYNLF